MTGTVRYRLPTSEGYRSAEIAGYIAQLDDLTRRMIEDLADVTVEELGWQPIAGCNTIGMLLAHIAAVEVFWIQVAPLGRTTFDTKPVLGISLDDDGMPMPPGGTPPAVLAGRDRAWFASRLVEARAHTIEHLRGLGDDTLPRTFTRTRANGEVVEVDLRWVLYHVVEHLSGHYGQILLLRHLYRDRAGLGGTGRR